MDYGQLLLSFDGRINRGKYWAVVATFLVVSLIALRISVAMYYIVALAFIWPGLAVQVKRWHDRGKSGWWVLIMFVPLIGGIWALVELGFLRGTSGPNQYGDDPLPAYSPA